jgi:hypothetical protein
MRRDAFLGTANAKEPMGNTLDIRQSRQDITVEVIQAVVDGDEAIARVQTNGDANEGAIDHDDVRLKHGKNTFFSKNERRAVSGSWWRDIGATLWRRLFALK